MISYRYEKRWAIEKRYKHGFACPHRSGKRNNNRHVLGLHPFRFTLYPADLRDILRSLPAWRKARLYFGSGIRNNRSRRIPGIQRLSRRDRRPFRCYRRIRRRIYSVGADISSVRIYRPKFACRPHHRIGYGYVRLLCRRQSVVRRNRHGIACRRISVIAWNMRCSVYRSRPDKDCPGGDFRRGAQTQNRTQTYRIRR